MPEATESRSARLARQLDLAATIVLTLLRLLFGLMFTTSGWLWLRRADPVAYLRDAVEAALSDATPVAGYREFLELVVLEWPGVFTALVATGELSVGLALLAGFPPRLGALGGVFLALNYGLAFGGGLIPPTGNFALAVVMLPLMSGRAYRYLAATSEGRGRTSRWVG